jgi:Sulfatase
VSCYSEGLMGYRTPNIDRIAAEGVRFTDYYGEQSCTAGRASFICGQNPYRTGLTKVGMPGANLGLRPTDPTIATVDAKALRSSPGAKPAAMAAWKPCVSSNAASPTSSTERYACGVPELGHRCWPAPSGCAFVLVDQSSE